MVKTRSRGTIANGVRVDQLNERVRLQIHAIDQSQGPLRPRVARTTEQIVRLVATSAGGDDARSLLIVEATSDGAPPFTVRDAQAIVLADFCRRLLETDFRHHMAQPGTRPFSYLVRAVRNQSIELWRRERGLAGSHERAAHERAHMSKLEEPSVEQSLLDREEAALLVARLGDTLPRALKALGHDELLLLVLQVVLHLSRDRIGEVLEISANATGQRLRRLRNRLYALVNDGRSREPDAIRARAGKASARTRSRHTPRPAERPGQEARSPE